MSEQLFKTIAGAENFEKLQILETNIQARGADSDEVNEALASRYSELGIVLISEKTGLDLEECTAAEFKIAEAVGRYVGLQKRIGKYPSRTFTMLANRGLIDTAERSVSKSKPTQGFEVLEDADMGEVSFEQIVVDHPEEFSPRAEWYARRTLGLANTSEKPPVAINLPTQVWTESILDWLNERVLRTQGRIVGYSNVNIGEIIGFSDLSRHGRILGNITSRIDFACYRCGLPPLGLVAETPFPRAWQQDKRSWAFPVQMMADAAQSRTWTGDEIDRVLQATKHLPGTASIPWKTELLENEQLVKQWAEKMALDETTPSTPSVDDELNQALSEMQRLEKELLEQEPKAKTRTSVLIERGTIGKVVKKANGYKCQVCDALGQDPFSFKKRNGVPYVEAHHVIPVSEMQIGSLAASNIMTLCANHHREIHYGVVEVAIEPDTFLIKFDKRKLRVARCKLI